MIHELRLKRARLAELNRELIIRDTEVRQEFHAWKQRTFATPTSLVWFFAAGAFVGATRNDKDSGSSSRSTMTTVLRTGLLGWRLFLAGPG